MEPIKPSPLRPQVGSSSSFHRTLPSTKKHTLGTQASPFIPKSTSNHYNSSALTAESGAKETPHCVLITDKDGNPIKLPRPVNIFRPLVSQDERSMHHSFVASSPPPSPFCRGFTSPVPSLMTATTATTTTETTDTMTSGSVTPYCFSPSPTAFLHAPYNRYYDSPHPSTHPSTPTKNIRSPGYTNPIHRGSPTKKRSPYNNYNNGPTEDATRKQRIKTELCTHYASGKICPFGDRCIYAHGEEELQMTKLMDLHRAGLIEDLETYRTKPCWTWVATGSCPFGKRCVCIHDPRIVGSNPSWLPHTETQGNSISTDINVDALYQKRMHSILYDNPFGDQFSLEFDDWADLYKLVCNTTSSNKRRRNNLNEINKLSIALQMRGKHGHVYKYRPQHLIYETLCMVLQKRAFRLDLSGEATEIPINRFNSNNSTHVLVREIAFGPDSDATVRGVALWFNIPEKDVSQCTAQQAKRFRWKKAPKFDDERAESKISPFDTRECFLMVRPHDPSAFKFATDILNHRYKTVMAERMSVLRNRFDALKALKKEKEQLQERFEYQRQNWIAWAWPITNGRQRTDDETPVPPVDIEYDPIIDEEAMSTESDEDNQVIKGSATQGIWDSYISQDFHETKHEKAEKKSAVEQARTRRRLPIFARLGYGEPIATNRSLPHIINSRIDCSPETNLPRSSERCWRALLLKEEKHHSQNEWEVVRDHFQNSRCKKVLSIIQQ